MVQPSGALGRRVHEDSARVVQVVIAHGKRNIDGFVPDGSLDCVVVLGDPGIPRRVNWESARFSRGLAVVITAGVRVLIVENWAAVLSKKLRSLLLETARATPIIRVTVDKMLLGQLVEGPELDGVHRFVV